MCFSSGNDDDAAEPTTPAPAPAPAIEPADPATIGDTRKKESEKNWGGETPNYRVSRQQSSVPQVNPSKPIVM